MAAGRDQERAAAGAEFCEVCPYLALGLRVLGILVAIVAPTVRSH